MTHSADNSARAREGLLDLLVTHSYRRADSPIFQLSSGLRSDFYINCKQTTFRGEAMPLLGAALLPLIPATSEAVGGLTLGADPLAYAIAFQAGLMGWTLNAFTVRKAAKGHGTKQAIEGAPGTRVTVLDDVATTGGSTIEAIERCRDGGLEVVGVAVLVDREEGGMAAIRAAAGDAIPTDAVFTHTDLRRRWDETR
jgi:orotate phosphoribosyltransferase